MNKLYYSVGVDRQEAMLGSMDFYRILLDTEAHSTIMGSDEDPKLYVLYDSLDHRDAAYEALKDRFRTAKRIYSPHQLEVSGDGEQAESQ